MNSKAAALRKELEELRRNLKWKEQEVDALERSCQHRWNTPRYTPIERPGYMAQNWMGPIRNGKPALPDTYIPPSSTPQWTRECVECGKTETTTNTNAHVTHTPKF